MGDKRKALPWAPVDKQVKISSYGHIRESPFEKEDGMQEMQARIGEGIPLYMKMPRAEEDEYVTPGVGDYQALRNLTETDLEDECWEPASADSVSDIQTPTYDDMMSCLISMRKGSKLLSPRLRRELSVGRCGTKQRAGLNETLFSHVQIII